MWVQRGLAQTQVNTLVVWDESVRIKRKCCAQWGAKYKWSGFGTRLDREVRLSEVNALVELGSFLRTKDAKDSVHGRDIHKIKMSRVTTAKKDQMICPQWSTIKAADVTSGWLIPKMLQKWGKCGLGISAAKDWAIFTSNQSKMSKRYSYLMGQWVQVFVSK